MENILTLLLIFLILLLIFQSYHFEQWKRRRHEKMNKMFDFFKNQLRNALEPFVFQKDSDSLKLWIPQKGESNEKFLERMKNKIISSLDTLLLQLPYSEVQKTCSSKKEIDLEKKDLKDGKMTSSLADCMLSSIYNMIDSHDWIDQERLKLFIIPIVLLWQWALTVYFYTHPSLQNVFLIQNKQGTNYYPRPTDILRVVPTETFKIDDINTYAIQIIRVSLFESVTPEAYILIRQRYRLEITREEANDAVNRLRQGNNEEGYSVITYNELVWFLLIVYDRKKEQAWDLGTETVVVNTDTWNFRPSKTST